MQPALPLHERLGGRGLNRLGRAKARPLLFSVGAMRKKSKKPLVKPRDPMVSALGDPLFRRRRVISNRKHQGPKTDDWD